MSSTLEVVAGSTVIGSLLPPVTAIVQQPRWSANAKRIVAVILATLVGVITVASVGGLDGLTHPPTALGCIAAVIAASQTTYDLIWKPSKIAPAMEAKTSPGAGSAG